MESENNKCEWCGEDGVIRDECGFHVLCDDCEYEYYDKTGFCGLTCCMTGNCDETC